ncbi:hypothetical protein [Pseudomonas nunensis]|nr:hypothetical protein [Pseudomonas nunensis]MDN3221129.1 hypothetical protein [Pseudomonas nunensis]
MNGLIKFALLPMRAAFSHNMETEFLSEQRAWLADRSECAA